MRESALIKKDLFAIMYDKTLSKVVTDPLKDSDTGHVRLISRLDGEFKCNVQNTSGQIMLKEFGKEYDAEYRVSCSKDVTIDEKNYVYKDNHLYTVVAFTETEQSKIFLIKRDDTLIGELDFVYFQVVNGNLVARSLRDILDGLEIDNKGVLRANGECEGISSINNRGELLIDPVRVKELLND